LASMEGFEKGVDALLQHPAVQQDINTADNDGNTALHHANATPNHAVVALLVKHGADPLIQNRRRETPLKRNDASYDWEDYKKRLVRLLTRFVYSGCDEMMLTLRPHSVTRATLSSSKKSLCAGVSKRTANCGISFR